MSLIRGYILIRNWLNRAVQSDIERVVSCNQLTTVHLVGSCDEGGPFYIRVHLVGLLIIRRRNPGHYAPGFLRGADAKHFLIDRMLRSGL